MLIVFECLRTEWRFNTLSHSLLPLFPSLCPSPVVYGNQMEYIIRNINKYMCVLSAADTWFTCGLGLWTGSSVSFRVEDEFRQSGAPWNSQQYLRGTLPTLFWSWVWAGLNPTLSSNHIQWLMVCTGNRGLRDLTAHRFPLTPTSTSITFGGHILAPLKRLHHMCVLLKPFVQLILSHM